MLDIIRAKRTTLLARREELTRQVAEAAGAIAVLEELLGEGRSTAGTYAFDTWLAETRRDAPEELAPADGMELESVLVFDSPCFADAFNTAFDRNDAPEELVEDTVPIRFVLTPGESIPANGGADRYSPASQPLTREDRNDAERHMEHVEARGAPKTGMTPPKPFRAADEDAK